MARLSATIVRLVSERAGDRCEYCRAPQVITAQTYHVDHIIPIARGGTDDPSNLAYTCPRCNLRKSQRMAMLNTQSKQRIHLFNPRTDRRNDHFAWNAMYDRLLPRSAIGRVTINALDLNGREQVQARRLWIILGLIP
jgi:hypothetical protein